MTARYDDEPPSPEQLRAERASSLATTLRTLPASRFTVNELGLLLRTNWGQFQTRYYSYQCETIEHIAAREGVE